MDSRARWFRAAWLLLIPPIIALNLWGFFLSLLDPTTMGTPQVLTVIESAGLPIGAVITAGLILPFTIGVVLGILIFVRRSDDPAAIGFSAAIVLMETYFCRGVVALRNEVPIFDVPIGVIWVVAFAALTYSLCTFPTGTFVPRWLAVFFLATVMILAVFPGVPDALMSLVEGKEPHGYVRIGAAAMTTVPLVAIVGQLTRYRRAGWVERQQLKWAMTPIHLLVGWVFFAIIIPGLFFEPSKTFVGVVVLLTAPLGVMIPLGMTRALLRYRLYDIDVVINRTLVYGALTLVLALTYVGIIFILQAVLSPIAADSDLAIAGSTLVVAALFRPLRSSVQAFIDRRFYRRKYDAAQTLEEFSDRVRRDVDFSSLNSDLLAVVASTMQPAHASLWLRNDSQTAGG